jgi:nucleoside-diphosphate-sugar epimerase
VRILITGSQGFIGSRLAKRLGNQHKVAGFAHQDDILNTDSLLAKMAGADIVIHAAAYLYDDPLACVKANVFGTKNVVESATICDCKAIVYLSTLRGMYKEGEKPIGEDSLEADAMGNYALSKRIGEEIVRGFSRRWLILRLSGVYGLGRKYRTLAEQMLTDEIVSVRSASELCDMVPVGDVVQAVEKAIQRLDGLESGTFIIASGTRQTVGEVAVMAQSLHSFVLEDRGEPAAGWCYDVSKARRLLGYEPTGLLEGLTEYKGELDAKLAKST